MSDWHQVITIKRKRTPKTKKKKASTNFQIIFHSAFAHIEL
jgi:hypothetical protein